MSGGLDGVFGGVESPLEGLRKLWGQRPYQRRTNGSPRRTKALATLYATAQQCDLPELHDLAVYLSEAWAGEDGWDTEGIIRGMRAAGRMEEGARPGEHEAEVRS